MCLSPVKTIPKRYYSTVYFKNSAFSRVKYDGQIYHDTQKYAYYPCGKCYQCKEQLIEQWQIRWKEHLQDTVPNSNYLLTLTYNDENLQYITVDGKSKSTLYYRHVQLFFKRLRKRQEKISKALKVDNPKISYHGCGEYGTRRTLRPHYHVLLSNCIVPPEEIQKIWGHGTVDIGTDVTPTTIKYILKYTLKHSLTSQKTFKIYTSQKVFYTTDGEQYNLSLFKASEQNTPSFVCTIISSNQKNSGRIAEKTFCSKSIGKAFLTEENIKYYLDNPIANYTWRNYDKKGNTKLKPLPRYYKEHIYNPNVIENGKIKRDDHGRPVKLWSPLNEDFEQTPRFKKLLVAFKRENMLLQKITDNINHVGYEKYIENQRQNKHNQHRLYQQNLEQRQNIQEARNTANMALLI